MKRALKQFLKQSPIAPFLMDLKSRINSPAWHREVHEDFIETKSKFSWVATSPFSFKEAKTVVILSHTNFIYQIKLEIFLALGLMLRGYRPYAIVSRLHPWACKYFRIFGIRDFIFWEDIVLTPKERNQCKQDVDRFLSEDFSFRDVKDWTYQGAWVGPQILSTISRANHLGAPDVKDPFIKAEIRSSLPKILENVLKAKKIFESLKPSMALVNEANGSVMGPLVDAAVMSGTNTIQFVQPSRDDALTLKRLTPETRRFHPSSVSGSELKSFARTEWTSTHDDLLQEEFANRYGGKWFLQSRNQPNTKRRSKQEIIQQLNLNPEKKIATVFSHVLWDANLFYGVDLFEDYGDWFIQTVRAAKKK